MQLQPKRQPGRVDRKAAAYADQIVKLRLEGYTYEAIREAMADAGIELSTSALRREVRRPRARPASPRVAVPASPPDVGPTVTGAAGNVMLGPPRAAPPRPPTTTRSRGHDIAEDFFNAHPSNPLVNTKEIP